jgi:chemotaxis protein methyltransferase CheR
MKDALADLSEVIRREAGLSLSAGRSEALRGAVDRVAPGLDPAAVLRATTDPRQGPGLMQRLIDEITVQESSFLRDAGQFDGIRWKSLHAGAAEQIRVWSAGCARGEEAYTLALLAAEAFAPAPAPVDVLGTDISQAALADAVTGSYRKRAMRGLSDVLQQRYLAKQPDASYLVTNRLRDLVRFRQHNLARDPIPPCGEARFDLIVCRNVLIYFTAPVVERVSRLLEQALRPGGMLVLGAADVLCRTAARTGLRGIRRARPQPAAPVPQAREPGPSLREPSVTRQPPHTGQPPGIRQRPGPQQPDECCAAGPRDQRLRMVLDTAGRGEQAQALELAASLAQDDPLNADAHFLHGLLALEAGEPARARDALRSALCADSTFGLAAFALGRTYDVLGDWRAAKRAYEQALRSLDPGDNRHEPLLEQIDLGDIAAACRARLEGQA